MGDSYPNLYWRSISDPDAFWREQAEGIFWETPYERVCDFSAPFARWFVGGRTNLCFNALDRHLATRGDQTAIYCISVETGERRTLSYRQLHAEVCQFAAVLRSLGMTRGDRAVIYMPMIPQAAIAMLACARLGIVHSAVFAGFAAPSLASRIDDAGANLVITADAGLRGGKLIPLKNVCDEALRLSEGKTVRHQIIVNRELDKTVTMQPGRDIDYAAAIEPFAGKDIPCEWLESSELSYLLYTSGTTAKPKGIQRDTGGYAVALDASMRHIYDGQPAETYFCTADIGWVVGHSYTVYGPLLRGMSTVIYEGLPTCPDAAIWWKVAEETRATVMFSSPTAIRTLKKHDAECLKRHDLSKLRHLFLAGEPLDQSTSEWIRDALGHVQIIDNYWQTETGWPILSGFPGLGPVASKPGSPGRASYGYRAKIVHEITGEEVPRGIKGVLAIELPLPPGCMSGVWKNEKMFVDHYCGQFASKQMYSTFDWAIQDEAGDYFILGRTDDVINVAGHRLGTREIEEAICRHPAVAEAAAIGPTDEVKGQIIKCFVTLKRADDFVDEQSHRQLVQELEQTVVKTLGSVARPAFIGVVRLLPKTRSGKLLRRALLAIAENRATGDITTIEDPLSLEEARAALSSSAKTP